MTVPVLSVSASPATELEGDVLVIGVAKTPDGPLVVGDHPGLDVVAATLKAIGVTGAVDEVRRIGPSGSRAASVALVGLGAALVTPDVLRYAAGSAARQLTGVTSLVIALPTASEADVLAVLEGAAAGAYAYTTYRSASPDPDSGPASAITVATLFGSDELVAKATVIAEAMHTVRDLVNAPPSDLYPETFAAEVSALGSTLDVSVTVLADGELADGGYGGIIAVGQGSTRGPRLVKVSYAPAHATKHLALVGKGITFDSGGLSLKPPASMIGMKYDMAGAATTLAVVLAAAKLQLGVRVTAWLCLAENLPSGSAVRPGDVIRIRGGKTVEVLNTDAEGRLVLADGLVSASEESPDAIIDVATLTGAASIAMGTRYVAVMGDSALSDRVVAAASRVGESFWAMPIPSELRPLLASDIADIANIKPGNTAGGMMIAAAFLKDFVGTTGEGEERNPIPWAHLDIASAANNGGSGYGFTGKGPTAVAVRALIELTEDFSRT
jgi:leucyl aminopeptidase